MTKKYDSELSSNKEYLTLHALKQTSEERQSVLCVDLWDHTNIQTTSHVFVALLDARTKKTNPKTYSKQHRAYYINSGGRPMEADLPLAVGGS